MSYQKVCPGCGETVDLDLSQIILSCQRNLAPYLKEDQTTGLDKEKPHTHGLGSWIYGALKFLSF